MLSLSCAAKAASFLALVFATPSDAGTFYSALSNCPAPCVAGSQPNSWTTYDSPRHLHWCNETMMIDFSLHNPLNDPTKHHVIRACTTTTAPRAVSEIAAAGVKTYPAKGEIQLISGGGGAAIATDASTSSDSVEKDDILVAIKHIQNYLGNDNTRCYNVHSDPDWMTFDDFNTGINKVCDDLKGVVMEAGSGSKSTVSGLKLEDGRDGVFVGEIKNTGQDSYTVDYDYCIEKMGKIRDGCKGSGDETYGGEWHDVIYVVADTNAA
ncbi:hypothetical protein VF21_02319 [Pseudogymnoascus sp. 05NY08]|nr:hypothetical protein VF21_02319 [Pseudogymnoascus sp. 05NY08]